MQLPEVAELGALSSQQAPMPNICNQVKTCNKPGNFGKPLLLAVLTLNRNDSYSKFDLKHYLLINLHNQSFAFEL